MNNTSSQAWVDPPGAAPAWSAMSANARVRVRAYRGTQGRRSWKLLRPPRMARRAWCSARRTSARPRTTTGPATIASSARYRCSAASGRRRLPRRLTPADHADVRIPACECGPRTGRNFSSQAFIMCGNILIPARSIPMTKGDDAALPVPPSSRGSLNGTLG